MSYLLDKWAVHLPSLQMSVAKGVLILALLRRRWKLMVLIHVQITTKVSKERTKAVPNKTRTKRFDYWYEV